jgi:hypothetical protein
MVTEAQRKCEVAQLDTQAAEQFKRAETPCGEGEGARRRLVMEADGALGKKPHIHQAKTLVMDLLPAVRVDRCWDAFSVDSFDSPPRDSAGPSGEPSPGAGHC